MIDKEKVVVEINLEDEANDFNLRDNCLDKEETCCYHLYNENLSGEEGNLSYSHFMEEGELVVNIQNDVFKKDGV